MNDRFKFRVWDSIFRQMIDLEGQESNPYNVSLCFQNHVMQCTGLKDRNKKDIYENDIVEFTHTTNIKCRGVIKFLKEDAMFVVVYKNPRSNKEDWDFMSKFTLNVIGNIYTTPELLEGKNE